MTCVIDSGQWSLSYERTRRLFLEHRVGTLVFALRSGVSQHAAALTCDCNTLRSNSFWHFYCHEQMKSDVAPARMGYGGESVADQLLQDEMID